MLEPMKPLGSPTNHYRLLDYTSSRKAGVGWRIVHVRRDDREMDVKQCMAFLLKKGYSLTAGKVVARHTIGWDRMKRHQLILSKVFKHHIAIPTAKHHGVRERFWEMRLEGHVAGLIDLLVVVPGQIMKQHLAVHCTCYNL